MAKSKDKTRAPNPLAPSVIKKSDINETRVQNERSPRVQQSQTLETLESPVKKRTKKVSKINEDDMTRQTLKLIKDPTMNTSQLPDIKQALQSKSEMTNLKPSS